MKNGLVFGAGVSGIGAEKTLKKMGFNVYLIDDKTEINSEYAIKILDEQKIDVFVKSPGVPYTKLVEKAKEKKIEIIDDVELGYRYKIKNKITGKIIAITGTNGKTTVTTKIKELLNEAGYLAEVCGNIGYSFSETVSNGKSVDFYILELSSYQLENIKDFKADIALLINLSPDHISRYKNLEEYYDTKIEIGKNQSVKEKFILNTSCQNSLDRIKKISADKIYVGKNRTDFNEAVYEKNNKLYYKNEMIIDLDFASLKGNHNLENMLFIIAVGKEIGVPSEVIKEFLYKTKTLEHRMENVFKCEKLEFINDSKGTNIDSTSYAIKAFKNPILICGGYDKKIELSPLVDLIKSDVKEVYLIGEISDKLELLLKEIDYSEDRIFNLKTLEKVFEKIKVRIKKEEKNIILFSPGTSSFDQFKNFEERGKEFKKLVDKYFN